MYAEFIGGSTYLRVRSFFFGDFLVFSVPFCEQPGQPHHERAHPSLMGGYRFLLEWVFFRLFKFAGALCLFLFLSGEKSTHSGIYFSTFQAEAQLHAVTK